MNLDESWDVRPAKRKDLLERIERLGIDVDRIEEQFVRGSGPGGQKINKTSSCVLLRYPPLELTVRCQKDRRRSINRFLALRELVDRIEKSEDPAASKQLARAERKQRNRARRKRRARQKARPSPPPAEDDPTPRED